MASGERAVGRAYTGGRSAVTRTARTTARAAPRNGTSRTPPARAPNGRGARGAAAGRTATARPAGRCGPGRPVRGTRRSAGSTRTNTCGSGGGGVAGRRRSAGKWGGPQGTWTWRDTGSSERTAAERSAAHSGDARRISARGCSLGVQRLVLDRETAMAAGGSTVTARGCAAPVVFGRPADRARRPRPPGGLGCARRPAPGARPPRARPAGGVTRGRRVSPWVCRSARAPGRNAVPTGPARQPSWRTPCARPRSVRPAAR